MTHALRCRAAGLLVLRAVEETLGTKLIFFKFSSYMNKGLSSAV